LIAPQRIRIPKILVAATLVAGLLATMPGLPLYAAAGQIAASRTKYAGNGIHAGPTALSQNQTRINPIAGMRFGLAAQPLSLSATPAIRDHRTGTLPKTTPSAAPAEEPTPMPSGESAAPSNPAPQPAAEAALPAAGAASLQRAQISLDALEKNQAVAAMTGRRPAGTAAEADARAAATKIFDGQFPSGTPAFDPQAKPVSRITALAAGTRELRLAFNGFLEKADLSAQGAAAPDIVPEPILPQGGKAGQALRAGLAGLMGTGLGIGFVLAGAAVAASAAIWSPISALVAGALGLGTLALALRLRLKPAGEGAPKPSLLPAALAGLGLLLSGGAASPLLVSLAGLATLHAASIALICALALLFEFLNGMHDAANSIATIVATKTLTPRQATMWAAFFNSIAYFFFGSHIATTIGSGLIIPSLMSNTLLVAALLGASLWNWTTVRLGIPVSSSHALIGGLVGAAVVAGGLGALMPAALIKTAIFMVASPAIGLAAAFALMAVIHHFFPAPLSERSNKAFAGFQLFSSAFLSLGHGGNDSQKTIGIITALLFANGYLGSQFYVPWPVAVASYLAMGLGTLSGGWRVIRTLGENVTILDRSMGAAAEVGAGAAIMLSTWLGIPVSTTHVVTGAVAGVGAAHGGKTSVKWGTLGKIAWAWALTIPFAALVSGLLYLAFSLLI